jgi:hypothetical protein
VESLGGVEIVQLELVDAEGTELPARGKVVGE